VHHHHQVKLSLPPRILDGSQVVCFARLGPDSLPTGRTKHIVGGLESPQFQGLVIIEQTDRGPYHLLYCDQDWNPITDTWHQTLDSAKAQAEFEYQGISQKWATLPAEA
jgi:hypothetical protein